MRVKSPCIKVCRLNNHDVCVGCGRTSLEIKEWPHLSNVKRADINVRAALKKFNMQGNLPFEDPK